MRDLPTLLVVARHAESVRNVAKAGQVFFPDPETRRGFEREGSPFFARPPGGESLADVAGRVQLFFESCERELAGRRVLLVTHAGTLRMIRFLLEHWTHDEAPARWAEDPVANGSCIAYMPVGGVLKPHAV